MSFSKRRQPRLQAAGAGFTLIELLVAAAISLIIFGVLLSMLVGAGSVKTRSALQLSVDESMRASLELMAMDLRESVGPRVVMAGGGLPSGLSTYASGSAAFTITRMDPTTVFQVGAPPSYSSSNPSYSNSAVTRIIQPNSAGKACTDVFAGGEYALVTTGTTSSWLRVSATIPCISNSSLPAINHPQTTVSYTYTPQAVVGRVDAIRYSVQTINGVSVLTRQKAGDAVQVVAPDITGLQVEYSSDGATFTSTPVQPRAMRLTLTGQRVQGARSSTLTLSTTVFMRDIAVPAPVTTAPAAGS
ncbi:PulJ/GspJ family protein [Deinococcus navajonensis]|uniref:Type II secretion system protein J n=1 Tax=Deinococcus navajonensis TaxID=309884 RepID=A0ABV8XQQ9_9DEIO